MRRNPALAAAFALGLLISGPARCQPAALHTYSAAAESLRLEVPAERFGQTVSVQISLPPGYASAPRRRYPVLYLNDGQDSAAVDLAGTLSRLYRQGAIAPLIVVAVPMLPDRMGTYGFSDRRAGASLPAQTRYGPVGARAFEYSEWLARTLVPEIDRQFRTIPESEARTVLGWSLGAANAFNTAWNYPEVFARIGGFSPSFWLSAKSGDPATAIAPAMIAAKPVPKRFAVYLAAGSAEETDDRDGDGVIDVIDDAQGVIDALRAKAGAARHRQFTLVTLDGGRHEQESWKRMLPDFLRWAYPVAALKEK